MSADPNEAMHRLLLDQLDRIDEMENRGTATPDPAEFLADAFYRAPLKEKAYEEVARDLDPVVLRNLADENEERQAASAWRVTFSGIELRVPGGEWQVVEPDITSPIARALFGLLPDERLVVTP